MDDAEVKRLREDQVEWADTLGRAEDLRAKCETQLMAAPHNLLIRLVVWLSRWIHRRVVEGEARARAAARATYDR
jgi:hypothetical protein